MSRDFRFLRSWLAPQTPAARRHLPVLRTEGLEDRVMPGLLTITPVASVVSSDAYIRSLPFAPNVGLTNAEGHTGGVVQWTPTP